MVDKWLALVYPSITFRISIHIKLYEYILTATICCVTIKMKFVFVKDVAIGFLKEKMDSVFWFRKSPEVNYEEFEIPVCHKKYK